MTKSRFFLSFFIIIMNYAAFSQALDTTSIFFAYDKSEIVQPANFQKLDSLCFQIIKYDLNKIEIFGYTDIEGSNEHNFKLSLERANTVKKYIINKGVKKELITICEGKGPASNFLGYKNEIDAAKCRRVDIICKRTELPPSNNKFNFSDSLNELVDLKVGERLRIRGLNFEPGRDILLKESMPILKKLLKILKENSTLKIRIEGHICCGPCTFCDISTERAITIYSYLVHNEIKSDRLSYKGFGYYKPLVYPEKTEEDRIMNRRVEILVVDR